MIVVDSSVWIGYFNGDTTPETEILDFLLGEEAIAIGDLILLEVLQGFRTDKGYNSARKHLKELHQVEMLGTGMAVKAAENYRKLRKKGVTIRKTADVIIASYCIDNKMPLLFSDKDFLPFVKHLKLRSVSPKT